MPLETAAAVPRGRPTHIDDPVKVGQRLRSAREAAGLTQRQLSFLGCTNAYISRVEAGNACPFAPGDPRVRAPAARLVGVPGHRRRDRGRRRGADPAGRAGARMGDTGEAARGVPSDGCRTGALSSSSGGRSGPDRVSSGAVPPGDSAARARRRAERAATAARSGSSRVVGAARTQRVGALESAVALLEEACEHARQAGAEIEVMRFAVLLANALIDSREFQRAGTCSWSRSGWPAPRATRWLTLASTGRSRASTS